MVYGQLVPAPEARSTWPKARRDPKRVSWRIDSQAPRGTDIEQDPLHGRTLCPSYDLRCLEKAGSANGFN